MDYQIFWTSFSESERTCNDDKMWIINHFANASEKEDVMRN